MKTMSKAHKAWCQKTENRLNEVEKAFTDLIPVVGELSRQLVELRKAVEVLQQKFDAPFRAADLEDFTPDNALVETDPAKINLASAMKEGK